MVEFDESQQFTAPRKAVLSVYAHDLPLGLYATRWMDLCDRYGATDNHPPYRDEQRAWYGTLARPGAHRPRSLANR
ncbi:MAG: hypothetical protein OXH15_17240 [Gammaproteobacteria bacterium]|nr:hypothetical protein [Gammaproteobacteria bacterium]